MEPDQHLRVHPVVLRVVRLPLKNRLRLWFRLLLWFRLGGGLRGAGRGRAALGGGWRGGGTGAGGQCQGYGQKQSDKSFHLGLSFLLLCFGCAVYSNYCKGWSGLQVN